MVHPIMDYSKLHEHIDVYTAGADICANKLKEWWQQGLNVTVLDLRQAYLQMNIERSLYQTVEIKGKRTRYCLTWLRFSHNVAPNIMTEIMNAVRAQRYAYVPSGNGIAERSHHSIKKIAARKQCTISEAIYWYKSCLKMVRPWQPHLQIPFTGNKFEKKRIHALPVPGNEEKHGPYAVGDIV